MSHNVLFICGSLNQTQQMHAIANQLPECNCFFSPYYSDGLEDLAARRGLLNSTILGGRHRHDSLDYMAAHLLHLDDRGQSRAYDLVFTCSDLIVPLNIRRRRLILIQEGITVPEGPAFHIVRSLKFLPRYLANTAATGLSDAYDLFCVASEGYRQLFIKKGVRPEKIAVTGIPNFDNLKIHLDNSFPFHGYVLIATSAYRESMQVEDRSRFIHQCLEIAGDRPTIFKLHPLENESRARKEIARIAPHALVLTQGNVNHMIANAETVITQQSSCTYVALALSKPVHTQMEVSELRRLMPIQNNGDSARRIAFLARSILRTPMPVIENLRLIPRQHFRALAWAKRKPRGRRESPDLS